MKYRALHTYLQYPYAVIVTVVKGMKLTLYKFDYNSMGIRLGSTSYTNGRSDWPKIA